MLIIKTLDFTVIKDNTNIINLIKCIKKTKVDEYMIKWKHIEEYTNVIDTVMHKLNTLNYKYKQCINNTSLTIYKKRII